MAKYVPDVETKRWVVVAEQRAKRPDETGVQMRRKGKEPATCVFCPGNEHLTPPETYRIGGEGGWNKPGWKVRVVPNKYPITDIHEVIIHSPDHTADLDTLPLEQVKLLIMAYRQRYQTHSELGHVLIFNNRGEHAGASLGHPHSQLVVIPGQINLETLRLEPIRNVVEENDFFTVFCPEFSQWPFETWISPKEREKVFGDITDEQVADLAETLQGILKRLAHKFSQEEGWEELAYNYYIYPGKDWYLRVIPRIVIRAGLELGTGLSVNVKDPIDAAEELRNLGK